MPTINDIVDYWRDATRLNTSQVAIGDQLRMMRNMEIAQRRAEAQVDCHITGEYNPPETDDMGDIYMNPLLIGDKAIAQLGNDDDQPQPPCQPHQPPRRSWLPWLMLAGAFLIGAGLISWAIIESLSPPLWGWEFVD